MFGSGKVSDSVRKHELDALSGRVDLHKKFQEIDAKHLWKAYESLTERLDEAYRRLGELAALTGYEWRETAPPSSGWHKIKGGKRA